MPARRDQTLELLRTINNKEQVLREATRPQPFGPAFEADTAREADTMEVWGTTTAAHEDYTEFRLLKASHVIGIARIAGY